MLLTAFIRDASARLETVYPPQEARGMVLALCEEKLGVKRYTHVIEPQTQIPDEKIPDLENSLDRLVNCEPLQYVLGFEEFCGRRFKVGPEVLIPRPETEELTSMATEALRSAGPSARALDLCTGSGCIAWSLFLDAPDSEVVAVDLSEPALLLAASQFAGPSPSFVKADVLGGCTGFDHGLFDVLVSNPPYVLEREKSEMRANVLDYEPGMALFVSDDNPLVFYRAIAGWARGLLKPSGRGFLEINEDLSAQTSAIFEDAGFSECKILQDFRGKNRFLTFSKQAL